VLRTYYNNAGSFDIEHSIKLDALTVCPTCGAAGLKRLIGNNTAFILKGGGFYETDYKRGSGSDYANKASAEKTAPATPCAGCDKAKSGECK
jgi:predicted nucleic acid-binding Zn ribbon protein